MADAADSDQQASGVEARGFLRRATKAAFATLGAPADPATRGWPLVALVTVTCAMDGSPILLLSTLAHHTGNLLADPRASLLIDATDGFANPQAGPRVTVMGRIARSEDESDARRFLARHPAARTYAGFRDFAFYRMAVERLHSVGGFARACRVERDDAILPPPRWREIVEHEDDVLDHMNNDHAETLRLFARHFIQIRAKTVRLIALDPDGFDLRCGRKMHRIDFPNVCANLTQIRAAFVTLAQQARASVGA